MDSEIGVPGKAKRFSGAAPPIAAPKMGVGNYGAASGSMNSAENKRDGGGRRQMKIN